MLRGLISAFLLAAAGGPAPDLALAPERHVLDNGLTVLLRPDDRTPMVAVAVRYEVGAFHEPPGRGGFAHLFEHLMFDGSAHVPRGGHWSWMLRAGGAKVNGATGFDHTEYVQLVPHFNLEVALWLESDRMGFLLDAVDDEVLEHERAVVRNERRQRVEDVPYGLAEERLWQALFPPPHPYAGYVVGSHAELEQATLDDVRAFHRTWYAPAGATLALVGNFDPGQARALIEKYFATLPGGPSPSPPRVAPSRVDGPVVLRHDEPVATRPALFVAWLAPGPFEEDEAASIVTRHVLAGSPAGRLHRRLVRETQLAQEVEAVHHRQAGQGVFELMVVPRAGVSTDRVLVEVDAVLAALAERGPTAAELDRAAAHQRTAALSLLDGVAGLLHTARLMQTHQRFLGDPDGLAGEVARVRAVTAGQVRRFVAGTLSPDRRVVLHAVPAAGGP